MSIEEARPIPGIEDSETQRRLDDAKGAEAFRGGQFNADPVYDDHDKLPGRPLGAESYGQLTRGQLGLGGYVTDECGGARWVPARKDQEWPPVDRCVVHSGADALVIWSEYTKASGDTRYGPEGLENASPTVGDTHEEQVVARVERTQGFSVALDPLRRLYVWEIDSISGDGAILRDFYVALDARFPSPPQAPWRSIPKSKGDVAVAALGDTMPPKRDRLRPGFTHDTRIDPVEE